MDKRQADVIKITKGLCIFFVVLGHTMIPSIRNESESVYTIWTIIYLFHMPVFFAVSGILFELNRDRYRQEPVRFLKNKFRLLIVPYITISIMVYLILIVLTKILGLSAMITQYVHEINSIHDVFFEIATYENHVAQHLWFVLVLFLIFCVNTIFRGVNQKFICVLLTIGPVFALPMLKMVFEVPDIPNYFLFELPFFMLGRLIAQNKKILERVTTFNFSPIVFAVLVWLYISFINGVDILPSPFRWIFLFIMRCMGIMMVFSISALTERSSRAKRAMQFLEEKSYPIYLLHQPFIVSGGAGVLYAIGIPIPVIILLITFLGLLIPLIIDKMFKNIKFYRVFVLGGRK
jgi:fucose 4-O-acetylase-like acetyltransferase